MKHSFLILIIVGLIFPIHIYATVYSDMKVSVEQKKNTDINSTSITLETLNALSKNVDRKSKEGTVILRRIDALKNLRKGLKISQAGLSEAQAKIIRDVFVPQNPEECDRRQHLLKGQTELKNIQSFDDFKRAAMSIINNK